MPFELTYKATSDHYRDEWAIWVDGDTVFVAYDTLATNYTVRAFRFDGSSFQLLAEATPDSSRRYGMGVWYNAPYLFVAGYDLGLFVFRFDGTSLTQVAKDNTRNSFSVHGIGNTIISGGVSTVYAYSFDPASETLTFVAQSSVLAGSPFSFMNKVYYDGVKVIAQSEDGSAYGFGLAVWAFNGAAFTFTDSASSPDGDTLSMWCDGEFIYATSETSLEAWKLIGSTLTRIASYQDSDFLTKEPAGTFCANGFIFTVVWDTWPSYSKLIVHEFDGTKFETVASYIRTVADGTYLYWSIFASNDHVFVGDLENGVTAFFYKATFRVSAVAEPNRGMAPLSSKFTPTIHDV